MWYILRNFWRADDPGYGRRFVNPNGNAYERIAVGASIAVATDDRIVMAYTVGWRDPDRPAAYIIPTHGLILIVDRLSLLSDIPTPAMVDAGYIDVNGTMEQASLIAPSRGGLRALVAYGSQSTTFARFLEVNDKMPEAMKDLYVKPYGGVRIAAPVFADSPSLAPAPPSGQPAWTTVRWAAAFPGGFLADYRFSVGRAGGEMRIVKDFSPVGSFLWTPLEEGDYTVRVAARNRESGEELGSVDASYRIVSPVPEGAAAVVTETNHPLVALFSLGSCPAGARMRVDFRPKESGEEWMRTGYARCVADGGANVYTAGLKGEVEYELRPVLVSPGVETVGDSLFHTSADPGLDFPDIRALLPADGPKHLYSCPPFLPPGPPPARGHEPVGRGRASFKKSRK